MVKLEALKAERNMERPIHRHVNRVSRTVICFGAETLDGVHEVLIGSSSRVIID
jgi:hypothetical protein